MTTCEGPSLGRWGSVPPRSWRPPRSACSPAARAAPSTASGPRQPTGSDRAPARRSPRLAAHPRDARATAGQRFVATDAVRRPPTARRHVRLHRTYRGLPVIGGDLVVHQGADGALARGQPDADEAPLDLSTTPKVDRGRRPPPRPLARSAATRDIARLRAAGAPRLVVDATRRPRRGSPGRSSRGGKPRRRHARAGCDVRRRPDRQGPPPRGADPDRRRLRATRSTAARSTLQVTPVRARRTSSRTRRAATPTRPT